jgi:hypothetical protein
MASTVKSPWLKKLIIGLIGKPLVKEFDKVSGNLKQAQDDLLKKTVESCKDTAFGRDHGFDKIATVEDYRKAVPIRDFEGHRAYVDRMTNGETDVLFPGKPLFYNTTSGTSNKPKQIPVSKEYFDEAYKKVSRLWLYTCLRDNPKLFHGKNLSAVGAAEEGTVADGTPYGSLSGAVYRNIPGILKDVYSVPYPLVCIKDYQKKYYGLLRCGLANDITYVVSTNPSSMLQFHRTVMENFTDMVRDIRDGTLRDDVAAELDTADRAAVLAGFSPDPERARFLEKIMGEHGENLRPKHYWPNLACINTWKQGNCAQVLPKLGGYFPETTAVREFGYMASEARAGLVLGNDWEYSVLAAHVYHCEFIEESQRDSQAPDVLLAHELEVGKQYYIYITNTSGLYRYDINDIVEITGRYNQVPLFRFVRKGDGFSSLTGEKLTETQVLEAMDRIRERQQLAVQYFTLCCDEKNLCYKLFCEFPEGVSAGQKDAFGKALDETLRVINPEYESKRGSNRLAAPALFNLPPDSYERVKEEMVAQGIAREGQYKVVYLQRKPQVLAILERLSGKTPA